MKKKLIIIVGLCVFVLSLSVYSINAMNNQRLQLEPSAKLINKNDKNWQKKIAKADVIHSDEFANKTEVISTSLEQLQNHSQTVIQGTIYNLQKMSSPEEMSYTKATIYVNRVISGDKSLKHRKIYVALDGGLVSFNRWYAKNDKAKDQDRDMLIKNDEFPLPMINSKIITGLIPNHLDEPTEYNIALKQSGFTISNSYAIENPRYNFWVKNPDESKYHLNNPQIKKKATAQQTRQLKQLTTQLNQKFDLD